MLMDSKNLVSITEANQNFSKVTKMVDANGYVVILKNNKPTYFLSKLDKQNMLDNALLEIPKIILAEHKHAFEVLAK